MAIRQVKSGEGLLKVIQEANMMSDDETKALKPRSKEINAVIADMVGVGPLTPGDPDVPLCVPLWYVTAYDQQGKKRGTGADTTLACAAAAAGFCPTTKLQINLAVFR